DALDPSSAEIALAVAPVAISIAQRLLDLFERDPIGGAVAAAIALGQLQHLLVAGMRRDAAFDPGHGSAPHIGHIRQHELGVALLHCRRAAAQALARLRLADQPMALVAPVALDLAG